MRALLFENSSSLTVNFLDVALSSDLIFGFWDTLPLRAKLRSVAKTFECLALGSWEE